MKTTFTYKIFRTFVITFIVAIASLNLTAQTTHNVAVTNYAFTPKQLTIKAGDKVVWTNTQGSHNVNGKLDTYPTNPEPFGNAVGTNWTYEYTFTKPGSYSYQCDPHAGMGMIGTITVGAATGDQLMVTVNFTGMTPHIGQNLWLAVVDQASKAEVGRQKIKATEVFKIEIPGIEKGKNYFVDFWADHNKNGVYDAPPVDHAWRLPLTDVTDNAVLNFAHNTNFTNINWIPKLTVHFTAMTPHVGQKLTLFVREKAGLYLDTVVINEVTVPEFDISSWAIESTKSYMIDFWADLNKNGTYNAPPVDHAWRINLDNVKSDTTIIFTHNTTFTDIMIPTAINDLASKGMDIKLYPNPASQYIDLLLLSKSGQSTLLKIYSIAGALIDQKVLGAIETYRYDLKNFKNGAYFIEISSGDKTGTYKFIKR